MKLVGEIVNEAELINEAHRLARNHAESTIEFAIRCGELLIEQKARLKHGQWQPWVEANCEFSLMSAKGYMKVSRQNDNALSFSSLREALGYDSPKKSDALERKKAEHKALSSKSIKNNKPVIFCDHYYNYLEKIPARSVDLLITDPPYSTDIDDIFTFVNDWLPAALSKVKNRAYICIGAYPIELQTYLYFLLNQDRFIVDNPLIWSYRNTLGVTPKNKYNLNYQVILHLYTEESRALDTSITNEMFSAQEINAPDGRQGDRFHTWQKPDELANRLIRHSTKSGDVVIDPFAGTGTFLIAAARHGCSVSGCDIDSGVINIAQGRGCELAE